MRQVADNIRSARKATGHTQQSLAQALRCSLRAVQGWEQGESVPTRANLEALSRLLGRDPGWFYTVHNDEPEPVAA